MARGFLLGGTAGRTTLAGEGLQHQDGHSHLLAYALPSLKAYDPAFAYELAVIIREGIRRMYEEKENLIYYLTIMNEFYPMPAMPEGSEEGILKGLYKLKASGRGNSGKKAHLLGSGTLLNEALKAAEMLEEDYGVAADVWSATSYKELYRDAVDSERASLLDPAGDPPRPYVERALAGEKGVFVAVSDYMKALPLSIARWIPGRFKALGTDGFGRSDSRAALRDFFEVDARYIVLAALKALAEDGKMKATEVEKAASALKINSKKNNPMI